MPTTGVPAGKGSRAPGIRVRVKRTNLNDHFLITPNDLVRGEGVYAGLTPHERIYLAAGLSYSDNYDTTLKEIDECVGDLGRDKKESVRRRLREAGFLTLNRISDGLSFIWGFEFLMDPLPPEDRDVLSVKKAAPTRRRPVELRKKEDAQVSPCPDGPGHGVTCGNVDSVDLTEALTAQALGGQGDVSKEEKNHSLEEEPPPPTPTTVGDSSDDGEAAGAAEGFEIEDQVTAVVDQVAADRPEWSKRRVVAAVREALADGRDPQIVFAAIRLVAADQQTRVPGRLNEEGDWWARAAWSVRKPAPKPAPVRWCEEHAVKLASGVECPRCTDEAPNVAPGASERPDRASEIDPKALALIPARVRERIGGVRS